MSQEQLILIAVGATALICLIIIIIFNKLVRRRNLMLEGWSNIDVQLKRRHVLIPNLLESVKKYMAYEQSVLLDVTQARNACVKLENQGPTHKFLDKELKLSTFLGRFWALAEDYPDLKANETFLDFQKELSSTEDKIQYARRYYNGSVRDFNILVESFPSNIVAKIFGFKVQAYFQIDNPMHRQMPKLKLDS